MSKDGRNVYLRFDALDGRSHTVNLPPSELTKLAELCLALRGQRTSAPGMRVSVDAFSPTTWSVGSGEQGDVVLGFELPTGGLIPVALARSAAISLCEALSAELGKLPATPVSS